MENSDLDRLRFNYKEAVDRWVAAIRAEEDLATPDHSMIAVELSNAKRIWATSGVE